MQTNRSYIFFAETPLAIRAGQHRCGHQLTPWQPGGGQRIHALGAPFYVAADGPDPVHA